MKILVADDHSLFRRGLSLLLSKLYPKVSVFEAKDVDEVVASLDEGHRFDLVLLDVAMPGMEGLNGLERLRTRLPDTPIVMLSAITNTRDIVRSIQLGARGYILKASSDQVLKHALSLVFSGETYIPSSPFLGEQRGGFAETSGDPAGFALNDPLRHLSERQREVLTLLMKGRSNKEIAKELGLLESTTKTHVKGILKKLGAANRTQAVMIAAGFDWPPREPVAEKEG